MAQEFVFFRSSQSAVPGKERKIKVFLSVPDNYGSDTGVLLLIAGFGADPERNVYKKMRRQFADQYNLLVVQTSYMGTEFMGEQFYLPNLSISEEEVQKLREVLPAPILETFYTADKKFIFEKYVNLAYPIPHEVKIDYLPPETEENHVDFGPLQALDCVNALIVSIELMTEQTKIAPNLKKVISYGHSHGAYLCHLCHRFYPSLFSLVIDNSAWIYPCYLDQYRVIQEKTNYAVTSFHTDYYLSRIDFDYELFDLLCLYKNFKNSANLILFQGENDNLVDPAEKERLFQKLDHCHFHLVRQQDVDQGKFGSTDHGLAADFLKLFDYVMTEHSERLEFPKSFDLSQKTTIATSRGEYTFSFKGIQCAMEKNLLPAAKASV